MINIAIDGPAGAGKSTVAKEVANRLKFIYVDTGAMYRALALECIRKGIDASDEESIVRVCNEASVSIEYIDGQQCVILNGENVNALIRTEEVSKMTSSISVYKDVRDKLTSLQRDLSKRNNIVMDGRDIGTTVLPDADVKIYLTASPMERARRRYEQLKESDYSELRDEAITLEEIKEMIIERDHRDMTREVSPLKKADDAILFDSSGCDVEESVERILRIINKRIEKV